MMVLHLSAEDWLDFQKVATHPKGIRFQLWFSEQIQRASANFEGMSYHIKTDNEGISKTADLGDGSTSGQKLSDLKRI